VKLPRRTKMSPGNRPNRPTSGIEGAAQITNPHATTINPITTIVFPNGAMGDAPDKRHGSYQPVLQIATGAGDARAADRSQR